MSSQARATWLKTASWLLIGFGLLFTLSLFTPAMALTELFLDIVIWPIDSSPIVSAPEAWLLLAISGGLIVGWGATFLLLVQHVHPTQPALVERIILIGISAWFLVDSFGSVIAGAPVNIIPNIGFWAMFALPILINGEASSPLPADQLQR